MRIFFRVLAITSVADVFASLSCTVHSILSYLILCYLMLCLCLQLILNYGHDDTALHSSALRTVFALHSSLLRILALSRSLTHSMICDPVFHCTHSFVRQTDSTIYSTLYYTILYYTLSGNSHVSQCAALLLLDVVVE